MSINKFKKLVKRMAKTYGVPSYLEEGDDYLYFERPCCGDALWFECPCCGDPILYEDWEDDEDLENGRCPICGSVLEA